MPPHGVLYTALGRLLSTRTRDGDNKLVLTWAEAPTLDQIDCATEHHRTAVRDLVRLGLGPAIIEICVTLHIDGGWLELLVLTEMANLVEQPSNLITH